MAEFGCGDGKQLSLADYPSYVGIDVSRNAVERCMKAHATDCTKSFYVLGEITPRADLVLSLDVIYHLVEEEVYRSHIEDLFESARRNVIIYSSDTDEQAKLQGTHIRHRHFTRDVADWFPAWHLTRHKANPYPYHGDDRTGSFADFYVYTRVANE